MTIKTKERTSKTTNNNENMAKDYSEDQLIQRSAAELMEKELGWTSVYAFDKEVLGTNGTLGRTSYHEVLLTGRFRKALKTLNPWLTDK